MGNEGPSLYLTRLKLEEFSLGNKFMLVEEVNNADGSFILSSVIKDQVDKGIHVILTLCHNSIGHFHSISQKLGYNLMSLKDAGILTVIDVMDKIVNDEFLLTQDPLKIIYKDIIQLVERLSTNQTGICIVVENLGNLQLAEIPNIFNFVQYLRGILVKRDNARLVCSFHNFPNSLDTDKVARSLKHVADIVVTLKDLTTGRASDVTGHLLITKLGTSNQHYEYQYHLQDKTISVFPPGTNEFACQR